MSLILRRTSVHYRTDCGENDYVVVNDDRVVGRIFKTEAAHPEGRPWTPYRDRRAFNRGHLFVPSA